MTLSLIVGPPNSGRAGAIRDELAAALAAEPVLVVPNSDDVARFERELCQDSGAMLGASVKTFEWLFEDVADAVGAPFAELLTPAQRHRAIALGARESGDPRMRALSSRPGFVEALAETVDDLQGGRVEPDAVREAAQGDVSSDHLLGVAAAYEGYLDLSRRLGRVDRFARAERAITGLRAAPDAWSRPVCLYGFDDLSPQQLALVEALSAAARVVVAVTYEPERAALAARATLHGQLAEIASSPARAMAPNPAHTESRTLYALERGLFEDQPERSAPDGGLAMYESIGELAEAETIGAEVAAQIAAGTEPEEIAIALRNTQRLGPLFADVLARLGVPVAAHAEVSLSRTGVGTGLIALVRALCDGRPEDLVAYLRAPGRAKDDEVDWLERGIRRERLTDLDAALAIWASGSGHDLDEVASLRESAPGAPFCRELAVTARKMVAGWRWRDPAILAEAEALEARAAELVARTAEELAEIEELTPGPAELLSALEGLVVPLSSGDARGRVQISSPYRLRAGRFAHVFVASLQEGEFPGAERASGLLTDDERSTLGFSPRADPEAEERYLFYVCVSRPTERLHLSWRMAGGDGGAESPSPFVEELREVLDPPPPRAPSDADPVLAGLISVRGPERVTLAAEIAPTEAELARSLAALGSGADQAAALEALGIEAGVAGPLAASLAAAAARSAGKPQDLAHERVLAALADRPPFGASTLEGYAACSYRWFVDHELGPQGLDPKPEPLAQGSVIHATLERLYADPPEAEAVPRAATLGAWRQRADELLAEVAEEHDLGPHDAVRRAGFERMGSLIAAFLEREASREWGLRPDPGLLEAKFGRDAEVGALDLGDFEMRGSIDRVDVGTAADGTRVGLVRDYKLGGKVPAPAKFAEEGRLQLQLYMLALRRLWGIEPIGGLYEPLGSDGRAKPRGPLLAEARDTLIGTSTVTRGDFAEREDFEEMLAAAERKAAEIVGAMRGGQVRRNPLGGTCPRYCTFQPICRRERAAPDAREDDPK